MAKKHTIKSDNGSLGESFKTIGTDHSWEGQELEVKGDPLIDNGTGRPIIMRFFEFKANPETFKLKPSNQELFNAHAQQIRLFLWKDGLEPVTVIEPKIIRDKIGYKIAITCQPKLGVALNERPETLQQLIKPNGK